MDTPQRDATTLAAKGTPYRRSAMDLLDSLAELFSAASPNLGESEPSKRAIPLSKLPDLIDKYEERRGIELLTPQEKEQVTAFSLMQPEHLVTVDDLMQLLAMITGATPSPAPTTDRPTTPLPPPSPSPMMLAPDPTSPLPDGSPAPRKRTTSTLSVTSQTSEAAPGKLTKRRSFLSALSAPVSPSSGPKDVSGIVVARGKTYLGVTLDGPLGEGFSAETEADKLRVATKGLGTREKEVIAVLGDKTYPQILAIDRAYEAKYEKSLLQLISSEKSLRGNLEYALKGLAMGPLNFDVFLLTKALEGLRNEPLLIDLLVARPPTSLALLRAAYRHRSPRTSGTPATKSKTLDASALASTNVKLKKAWEVILQGQWEDVGDTGEGQLSTKTPEEKIKLLREDLDQLKFALRKNGNSDIVTKIIFARSPEHIHQLTVDYKKQSATSLTRAIKQNFTGMLLQMLLYACETGKNDSRGPGVWRDAKLLEKTMEGAGTRNEALTWRLVRMHWDRPRFQLIQAAFKAKYNKQLLDRVAGETSGTFRDALRTIISSANVPEPIATLEDTLRLEAVSSGSRSRGSSVSSQASRQSEDASDVEPPTVLEATGELSNPPSPRSPPTQSVPTSDPFDDDGGDQDTPLAPSFAQFESITDSDDRPETPTLPTSSGSALDTSTSSTASTASDASSTRGHKSSSSLSFRQRSSPLEPLGHRPGSSSGGSFDKSLPPSSLRHSRPVAPSRRRKSEDITVRAGSTEPPTSPNSSSRANSPLFARSSTPNDSTEGTSTDGGSRSTSRQSNSEDSTELQHSQQPPPLSPLVGSPPAGIDTTSYHAAPISPVGDVGSSPSPFSSMPPPESPFNLSSSSTNFFGANDTPEKYSAFLRRQGSTLSMNSSISGSGGGHSRPGSMFQGEGTATGGMFPGDGFSFASGSGDQFQNLARHAGELSKKLKEAEARLQASASSYEQDHSELEAKLEEARSELQIKRREEKELRGTEKQHLVTISSLETDIAKLTKSLEKSRESYEAMKRNYSLQCEETEKLRTLVAETRRENRAAEEAAHLHGLQVQQSERDRQLLQGAIDKLEGDLAIARRAQDSLDDQKQENLLLKETIDRLRFDLDEMRSKNRQSLFMDDNGSNNSPTRGSIAGSMSKSLGKELARRLAEQGQDEQSESESEGEETEGEDEEVDDIVVTTHRRIKKKKSAKSAPSEPTITHVQQTTVVADVETQTDPIPTREMDIQTDLVGVRTEIVNAADVVVAQAPPPKSSQELQLELAKELGIDLKRFEDFVDAQNREKDAPPAIKATPVRATSEGVQIGAGARRAGRWATRMSTRAAAQAPALFINVFPDSARPYVAQILESSMTFFFYSATVFLVGCITGSTVLPINHHHHFAPFHVTFGPNDMSHNTLGSWEGVAMGATGGGIAREGVAQWIERLVWSGVRTVQRIPT